MTLPIRLHLLGPLAALALASLACDAPEAPGAELREGQTAEFKTTTQGTTFVWKNCDPPWGPEPWEPEMTPPEDWLAEVGRRVEGDLPAFALGARRDAGLARECEAGCAGLGASWNGYTRVEDLTYTMRGTEMLGWCDDEFAAWSTQAEVESAVVCGCE